uniref:Uncharacterized protein n=1 Tax=Meloidogyne incognita TaxID=6306 RepID=A0A914KSW5_MELIC
MSHSGHSNDYEPDMRLSSLTVGQFWKAIEENEGHGGHKISYIILIGSGRGKIIDIWDENDPIPVNELMEEFLRDAVFAYNQREHSYKRQIAPFIQNRTVLLHVRVNIIECLKCTGSRTACRLEVIL